MRSEGWDTALDYQTELIRQAQTRQGQDYLRAMAASLGQSRSVDARTGELVDSDPDYAFRLVSASTAMLQHCDPMYVSADLARLVNYAAESFKPEPIERTDLLMPAGFAYFGEPIEITDTHGVKLLHRAISWAPTIQDDELPGESEIGEIALRRQYTGLVVSFYTHRLDPDAYASEDLKTFPGGRLPKLGGSDLSLAHVTTIRFGERSPAYEAERSIRDVLVHLKVFFRLCQQTIAVRRPERVARPVWKRASSWRQIKEVVVVTLRHASMNSHYEGEEREVQWTHRWIVEGHWRWQYYPSEKAHHQIWIAPYVKGPDGKPLIFKRRAYELVR